MLRRDFFFLDIVVNHAWHAAATKAARQFEFGLALGVAHKASVKRFLSADVVVVVKRQLAAFAAL